MPSDRLASLIRVSTRAIVCLALLSVSGGIFAALYYTRPEPSVERQAVAAPPVMVIEARSVPVRRQWTGYGTATAMDSADVPARVGATVAEIPDHVLPGQSVEAGELLVALDDTDFVSQVEISTQVLSDLEAQLERLAIAEASWRKRVELTAEEAELARVELERVKLARSREAAKPREVDQAQTALIIAVRNEVAAREQLDTLRPQRSQLQAQRLGQQAQLRLARENLQRCRIVSPLAGVIQSVDVEVGENLQVGQRVARVVSVDRIEVPLRLPAGARHEVGIGDTVELRSAGSSRRTWPARIARLSPEDDARTRTVAVYVVVEHDGAFAPPAPGTFMEATVVSGRTSERWVVPRRAISGDRIKTVRGGVLGSLSVDVDYHVEQSLPELGVADTLWAVLESPLSSGLLVMLDPSRAIPEGAQVDPVFQPSSMATGRPVDPAADPDGVAP